MARAGPDPDPLPEAAEAVPLESARPLHPRAVALWRINAALHGGFLVVAAAVAEWLIGVPLPAFLPPGVITGALAILAVGNVVLVPPRRYRRWTFTLRPSDLYIRYGILFRTSSVVPLNRIQHVDTNHGPLERALGLADLVVYTAGIRGAIITVPALGMDEAESLRDRLADLSGAGDAV